MLEVVQIWMRNSRSECGKSINSFRFQPFNLDKICWLKPTNLNFWWTTKLILQDLPSSLIASAAHSAMESGNEGKWKFTLHNPSVMPFLQYAENRQLREKMYNAYINRCNHNDELDNKEIVANISALRAERAQLLGYKTHADFVLEESMAKTPDQVYELLNGLWKSALPVAKNEALEMQNVMNKEGNSGELEAWDWAYYADKVRKEKYNYNAEELRPYFQLEKVRDGIFFVCQKLYGSDFH